MTYYVRRRLFAIFVLIFLSFHSFSTVFAQDINYLECQLSEPTNLGSSTEDFEYSKLDCNLGGSFEIQATNTTSTFFILREFTYADIIEITLLFAIFGAIMWFILKNLFVPPLYH